MNTEWIRKLHQHRYGFSLFVFIVAALATGAACVLFARSFEWALSHRLDFSSIGGWAWVITPIGFLVAVEIIRRTAPFAAGTGIPQAIFASEHFTQENESRIFPLLSPWTVAIKVLTLLLGIWVGASTGREGPTVHVAVGVFVGTLLLFRRWLGFEFDGRSAAIAGGAAGLAAAFNTPLAGVTFAVEELSEHYFASVKDIVLMAIIVSAVMAKMLTGEYAYFGRLAEPSAVPLYVVLTIGLVGGTAGILFGYLLLQGSERLKSYQKGPARYLIPIVMALGILGIVLAAGLRTIGPGNRIAQELLNDHFGRWAILFPWAKMATTLMTYWSGLSGGIFAPCLSMGAGIGSDIAYWTHLSVPTCALIGMAAFLSGAIQAPMTSFVIIFEMSGHHQMLVPLMLASVLPFMIARALHVPHLYKALASGYDSILVKND
jgi:chloride channel protein, CIC family